MNNYQLLMAFVSGMNNSALLRLKWTRAKVSKRALTTLKELEDLMNMEGSFKAYRAALEASSPPCIPYVYVRVPYPMACSAARALPGHAWP